MKKDTADTIESRIELIKRQTIAAKARGDVTSSDEEESEEDDESDDDDSDDNDADNDDSDDEDDESKAIRASLRMFKEAMGLPYDEDDEDDDEDEDEDDDNDDDDDVLETDQSDVGHKRKLEGSGEEDS